MNPRLHANSRQQRKARRNTRILSPFPHLTRITSTGITASRPARAPWSDSPRGCSIAAETAGCSRRSLPDRWQPFPSLIPRADRADPTSSGGLPRHPRRTAGRTRVHSRTASPPSSIRSGCRPARGDRPSRGRDAARRTRGTGPRTGTCSSRPRRATSRLSFCARPKRLSSARKPPSSLRPSSVGASSSAWRRTRSPRPGWPSRGLRRSGGHEHFVDVVQRLDFRLQALDLTLAVGDCLCYNTHKFSQGLYRPSLDAL